ncbi:MAG: hypothetical protein A3D92_03520 [Bacteroidetes bacterium RIFCSPHIGHO2_02_FULL_44_7]|nr:MAG: hypothetical protein A3D92_03520 [Bacteroidetes bacterium RIFCSPHIGHO2_02_FULL_44_7]
MIRFQQEDTFLATLRTRVDEYFLQVGDNRKANFRMKLKMLIFFIGLFASYISIYFSTSFALLLFTAFLYGLFSFLLAFNIVHDAGHYALFQHKKHNELAMLTLDLFGISSFIWQTNHNLHHYTPNVLNHDSLVDDFKLGKIVPNGPWHPIFRYQVFYIPILSLFYSFSLVLVSDFIKFPQILKRANMTDSLRFKRIFQFILTKILGITISLIIPAILLQLSFGEALLFFLMTHLGPGIMVGFFVAPSHFNTHVKYPEVSAEMTLNGSWSAHQLDTTEDFEVNNPVFNFILGGFNHHVAHHLFPEICHIHYPQITQLISITAHEYGLTHHQSRFLPLYRAHLIHLVNMAHLRS